MKILKSGVETTPEELSKITGGKRCACGCDGGYNSGMLWTSGDIAVTCFCGCTGGSDIFDSPYWSARDYPY
ncbi:MAG: hypothetical protein PVH61_29150 [Candidatus Aminicenantes bacterium]|jgi:hypothetical protein